MSMAQNAVVSSGSRIPGEDFTIFAKANTPETMLLGPFTDRFGNEVELDPANSVFVYVTQGPGQIVDHEITGGTIASNIVTFDLPAVVTPGVLLIEIEIKTATDVVANLLSGYLNVSPRISRANTDNLVATVKDIRSRLHDEAAVVNDLLQDTELTDSQICESIFSAVGTWNEIRPNDCRYTPASFPHKELLIQGTCAACFRKLANNLNRNELTVQGAANLNQRAKLYLQLARDGKQEYVNSCRMLKYQIGIRQFTGSVSNSDF